jgi:hypothetical protein
MHCLIPEVCETYDFAGNADIRDGFVYKVLSGGFIQSSHAKDLLLDGSNPKSRR